MTNYDHIIDRMTFRVQRHVTTEMLNLTDPEVTINADHVADRLYVGFKATVTTERLPVQTVRHEWHGTHAFTFTEHTTVPRHATWWDHFKDTYRARWWLRALVQRRPPQYIDQTVTVHVDKERACRHDVAVPVRAAWIFPKAPPIDLHLGPAYVQTWHDDPFLSGVDTEPRAPR